MLTINIGPFAQTDLQEQYKYFTNIHSSSLAQRFFQAAQDATLLLGEFPGHGSYFNSRHSSQQSIRCWAIKEFPRHIIYYRIQGNDLQILRVLHGARRVSALLRVSL